MMQDGDLDQQCQAHGVHAGFHDLTGQFQSTSDEIKHALLTALGAFDTRIHEAGPGRLPGTFFMRKAAVSDAAYMRLEFLNPAEQPVIVTTEDGVPVHAPFHNDQVLEMPSGLPFGAYTLHFWSGTDHSQSSTLLLVPDRIRKVDHLPRLWGITAPLYGLKSKRNWGIGDFEDLACFAENAAAEGAAFIGINPVHALFPGDADRFSPYSPSSRIHLNILHIAPDQIPEFQQSAACQKWCESDAVRSDLRRAQRADLVDYSSVYSLKRQALRLAFEAFETLPADHPRRADFSAYLAQHGARLKGLALYEMIAEHLGQEDSPLYDWRSWGPRFKTADAPGSLEVMAQNPNGLRFHCYTQWLAEEQLAHAHTRALEAGMLIGLYLDLAVGMTLDGAEAWANADSVVQGISLGAPGDAANPDGQMWNIAPLNPNAMQATGFAHYRQTLSQIMSRAGMVRIDHILGLNRSYWCPVTGSGEGGYVSYPLDDLLGVIAMTAEQTGCLVIGEDLGMVPPGFREKLHERGLFGCAVFYMERNETGAFRAARDYPDPCLAALSNHDFPTLAGYLEKRDLQTRATLGIGADPDTLARDHVARDEDLVDLRALLEGTGLLKDGDASTDQIGVALHAYLSQSNARLLAVQVEDLLGQSEQMNVPGTVTEHPNWRRKLKHPIETLFKADTVQRHLNAVRSGRLPNA